MNQIDSVVLLTCQMVLKCTNYEIIHSFPFFIIIYMCGMGKFWERAQDSLQCPTIADVPSGG